MFSFLSSFLRAMSGRFYAVHAGRQTGVFRTWPECQKQVKGFAGARFKKFDSLEAAQRFVGSGNVAVAMSPFTVSKRKSSSVSSSGTKRFKTTSSVVSNEDPDRPIVYSDGCCTKNGRHGARAGVGVYWSQEHPNNVCERLQGHQTNQRAELMAAIRALESAIAQNFCRVELRTDSSYTINGVTSWIKKWKMNGFKVANGQDVKNKDDFVKLDKLCQQIDVKWTHVPGHCGIAGNEAADALAKQGAALNT